MAPANDQLIVSIAQLLLEHKWKLVTAESCTGGGLAYMLTDFPGSSNWFERGFVTYSNLSKQESLGVSEPTLIQFGAVSHQTASAMAKGALEHSQAQMSIAITGIAGPGGGTIDKEVGTVWLAWAASQGDAETKVYRFKGDRKSVRQQAIRAALENLFDYLKRK